MAMATGTGKTRTVLSIIYLFLPGRFLLGSGLLLRLRLTREHIPDGVRRPDQPFAAGDQLVQDLRQFAHLTHLIVPPLITISPIKTSCLQIVIGYGIDSPSPMGFRWGITVPQRNLRYSAVIFTGTSIFPTGTGCPASSSGAPTPSGPSGQSACPCSFPCLCLLDCLRFPEFLRQPLGDHADGDEGVDNLLIRGVPAVRLVLRNDHVRSSFPGGFLPLWFLKEKSGVFFRKIPGVFFGNEKARFPLPIPEREKRAVFPKNGRKNFL